VRVILVFNWLPRNEDAFFA